MLKKLFICEKPSQARDIARVLGAKAKNEFTIENENYIITWCLGHLLETAKPDFYRDDLKPWRVEKLPVIPTSWKMLPVSKVKKQLTAVKKLVKSAKHIIIATDADREGELIAREILTDCNYKGKIERLWLSALDDASIRKALKAIKPGEATEALYHAGLGRQRADWLIGMNMTMATSVLFGKYGEGVLSVGRVQTPTLKLIVDRDIAIENFKPQDYFELFAQFIDDSGHGVWLKWQTPKSLYGDEQGHCLDKNAVEDVAKKIHASPAVVTKLTRTNKKQSAPLPFSLSALQKRASASFGFTAKKTLDIAQELYEKHKATTYPRTDSGYLPVSQFSDAPKILAALSGIDSSLTQLIQQCDTGFKSPAWNDKKVGAHHGIIPTTNSAVKLSAMTADCKKIYQLIRNVYIAQFLGDYHYKHTVINVACNDEIFAATGKVPLKPGWKVVLTSKGWGDDRKGENETEQELPDWHENQPLHEHIEKVVDKKTKPPSHFTEGTIIAAMESIGKYVEDKKLKKILKETSGIGTQATRASILDTLIARDYINRDKKKLMSTPRGRALIEILPDNVKDPATTASWEQNLEEVAKGNFALETFISSQVQSLNAMLDALKLSDAGKITTDASVKDKQQHACPTCGKTLRRLKPKGKNRYFWGCSGYPDCNVTLPDFKGKPGKAKAPAKKTDEPCTKCDSGFMMERKGKYGKFYGCSNYPKCKNLTKKLSAAET